jgi:hypothetical protein
MDVTFRDSFRYSPRLSKHDSEFEILREAHLLTF